MRRSRVTFFTAVVGCVFIAACSSSHDASSSTSTTSPPAATTTTTGATTSPTAIPATIAPTTTAPAAQIVSFTGPRSPVVCNAPTSVELHWVTQHASLVTLQIDGGPVFAKYSNGPHDVLAPLTCDGNPQTYRITAHGASGRNTTKSVVLKEREST